MDAEYRTHTLYTIMRVPSGTPLNDLSARNQALKSAYLQLADLVREVVLDEEAPLTQPVPEPTTILHYNHQQQSYWYGLRLGLTVPARRQ